MNNFGSILQFGRRFSASRSDFIPLLDDGIVDLNEPSQLPSVGMRATVRTTLPDASFTAQKLLVVRGRLERPA